MTPALHSFYETGLATAANAQIARALGLDRPHPMDCGWPRLAADIVDRTAMAITDGRLAVPGGAGLGVVPDPDRLAGLRAGEIVVVR
jgi:L-alanine-DL-glutamate epimerase-like enolase superfamily enzyme